MDREALVKGMLNGRQSKYPLSAQTVPMNVALNSKTDPAMMWPGAPPNWGQPDMPHIFSFVGRYGMVANAYMHADEALMHSSANAEIMRNEPMIMECIEARMRCVALLNWHIQPVDNDVLRDALDKADSQETAMRIRAALKKPKSDAEVIADKLTSILKHTPHFMKMRYSLMDAIWYGKTATVQTMGVRPIGGQRRIFVRKWEPRHGDKLIFRYADGSYEYDPDQVGIRIGPTTEAHDDKWIDYAGFERQRVDATQHGFVYWFDGQQRRRICLHKHIIEDGDFMRPEKAGSINGVGIRSRIYWTWWAYQESLKLLLEYVERSALGIEIWKYPAHDPKAKERTEKAAQERGAPGRSVVLVPIPTGEYGDMYGVQIVEPGLGGISELQSVLQTFFGHKIKRYILGQTLTSEAEATGMGSGVADAHLATFHDIVRFDGLNLEETITTDLLRPLQQWNFPGTDDIFLRFVIDTESPDAQERIASYQAAWAMGVKIRTEDVYDALGASPPTEGDDYLDNPGLEAARISNEAQKQQIAQQQMMMQAQMGGGPQQFVPFPNLEGGGVQGDGDGDGMAGDEESQLYRSQAKVERYAADHKFVTNLKDEHHQIFGDAIANAGKGLVAKFYNPSFYEKHGVKADQDLTHDDQHLILWHANVMNHPHIGRHLFGPDYKGEDGGTVPNMPLQQFVANAHRAIKEQGDEAIRQRGSERLKGARVASFKNASGGRLVLHPAVRKDATSKWQLTSMSGHDGKPNGHENPPSFDHGWQRALGVSDDHYWNQHGYEVEWTDKDGTKAPFAVDGDVWHTIERFGRYKPMQGQGSFDWDESAHPREQEAHDGKMPGEFAPKAYEDWDSQRHERNGDKPTSYLTGHSSDSVRQAAKQNPGLGLLITPLTQQYINHAGDYSHIALDNGVYSEFKGSAPFSPEKFRAMIAKVAKDPALAAKTQFVVAPDVVGDWEKTLERSKPWLAEIRKSGLPVAFAAQDGIEKNLDEIPWDDFDVLFIGGSTAWKLGFNPIPGVFRPTDDQLRKAGYNSDFGKMLKEAKARGKRIHMGRVNSWKRAEMANYGMQLDTMDGNFIGVAPDQNLPKVLGWLNAITHGMKKPSEQQPNPRAWTNNGDGTWTTPNGTVWKKASKDGEVSPVNGKPYRGGELMPIHGLASGLPKPEPKPKRDKDSGQSKVDEDGRQKDDWKEPKIRQLTPEQIEREKEKAEEYRRWGKLQSGSVGKAIWMGDVPGKTGYDVKKQIVPYLASLSPEHVKSIGEKTRQRYIESEVKKYGETLARTGESVRELAAEDFDRQAEQDAGMFATKKIRAQFPEIGRAIWGIKKTVGSEKWASFDDLEWLESILSGSDKHSAQAEVDRYGKVKPMAGQAAFDFDRQEPNKQAESQPAPEAEPEPTHPFAIRLKRYLELKDKAVRAGLKEPRTDLLK